VSARTWWCSSSASWRIGRCIYWCLCTCLLVFTYWHVCVCVCVFVYLFCLFLFVCLCMRGLELFLRTSVHLYVRFDTLNSSKVIFAVYQKISGHSITVVSSYLSSIEPHVFLDPIQIGLK
jgi:hypothetical protein